MPMPYVNKKRVAKAATALRPYLLNNGSKESVVDLLTDLRHFADAHGINIYVAMDMSYQHYLAEKKG